MADWEFVVSALCEMAGIQLADGDIEDLSRLLQEHLSTSEQLLAVDTQGVEPITEMDPSW